LCVGNLSAQVFWSEDFQGGAIPAGWSTTDGSNQNIFWKYCSSDTVGTCVNLFGEADPATTTASNGLMVMDSDGNAGVDPVSGNPMLLPMNHLSRLTTSAINCTAKPKVILQFEMYFMTFDVNNRGKLFVSTDNINYTEFNIPYVLSTVTVGGQGNICENPFKPSIDISSVAANKSTVYLRWEYDGNWDYWFFLDDVKLTTIDPTPPLDLKISDSFYPLTHYKTPNFAIAKDTFGLSCNVTNTGSANQTALIVKTWVYDDLNNMTIWQDSLITNGLAAGKDSQFIFTKRFAPELPLGLYSVHYKCYVPGGGIDATPNNNSKSLPFEVSDGEWALEDGIDVGTFAGGDWAVGNVFNMLGGSLDNYVLTDVTWQCGGAANVINSKIANFSLFLVDDAKVDAGWNGFESADFFSNSFIFLAEYQQTYPASGNPNYPVVTVVPNSISGGPVPIVQGKRYIAAVNYEGTSNTVRHGFSNDMPYSVNSINSIVYAAGSDGVPRWFLGGFQGNLTAMLRMTVSLSTTTDNQPLPEAALSIFPNPTSDLLNLQVNFDKATDATITLADASGKVISIDEKTGLTNESLSYNLSAYAAGTYIARIATKEGTKTKQFVVVR
jgi:Secretion system C-terminal sorting domain